MNKELSHSEILGREILVWIREHPGCSMTDVQHAVGAPYSTVRGRIVSFSQRGLLQTVYGPRGVSCYHSERRQETVYDDL